MLSLLYLNSDVAIAGLSSEDLKYGSLNTGNIQLSVAYLDKKLRLRIREFDLELRDMSGCFGQPFLFLLLLKNSVALLLERDVFFARISFSSFGMVSFLI